MKVYNTEKLRHIKIINSVLKFIKYLRIVLFPLALFIRLLRNKKRPDFLIADGFLIGDTVLARPLIKAILKKYSDVYYLGGMHAKIILQDIPVKLIINQWLWASYNYSFKNILKQISIWWQIFCLQPKNIIELRGDIRSLFFLYFTYPEKLIGYSFTGGKTLLDLEPNLPDEVMHLETHNKKLAEFLGLEYQSSDIQFKGGLRGLAPLESNISPTRFKGRSPLEPFGLLRLCLNIGLSFSGSLPLKTLPLATAKIVVDFLREQYPKAELIYLLSPKDYFYDQNQEFLRSNQIQIWQGNFQDYFEKIANLDFYVGMDSAGAHLASMFDLPSVIFFGTQESFFAKPIHANAICLETKEKLDCRPCAGKICVNSEKQKCLLSIKKKDIIKALNSRHKVWFRKNFRGLKGVKPLSKTKFFPQGLRDEVP